MSYCDERARVQNASAAVAMTEASAAAARAARRLAPGMTLEVMGRLGLALGLAIGLDVGAG